MARIYFDKGEKIKFRDLLYRSTSTTNNEISIRLIKKYNYISIIQQFTPIINDIAKIINEYCYEYYTIYAVSLLVHAVDVMRIQIRVYDKQYFDFAFSCGYRYYGIKRDNTHIYNVIAISNIHQDILSTRTLINYNHNKNISSELMNNHTKSIINNFIMPELNHIKYNEFTKPRPITSCWDGERNKVWIFNDYMKRYYNKNEYLWICKKNMREQNHIPPHIFTNNHYINNTPDSNQYVIHKITNHKILKNIIVILKILSDQIKYVMNDISLHYDNVMCERFDIWRGTECTYNKIQSETSGIDIISL